MSKEENNKENIIFISEKHKKFYYEKLEEVREQYNLACGHCVSH